MNELERSFIGILLGDVIAARHQMSIDDAQPNRRHLVKSTFAAIDGIAWLFREHIRSVSEHMGYLTPLADMALREQAYSITEHGEIVEQVRYVTLPTSIRLTVKQAQRLNPNANVDFSEAGWSQLREGITIRNRITHPKVMSDLTISAENLNAIETGFAWLLSITTELMSTTNATFIQFNKDARELLEDLKRGDPDAIRLYEEQFKLGE